MVRAFVEMTEGQPWAEITAFDLPPRRTILHWQSGPGELAVENLATEFSRILSASGFATSKRALFETESAADFQVGAIISRLGGRLCSGCGLNTPASHYRGAVTMSVEWQVYSPRDRRVVATVTTKGGFDGKESRLGIAHLLNEAFRENTRQLLNTPEFRNVILSAPTAPTPSSHAPITLRFVPDTKMRIEQATQSVASIFSNSGLGSAFLVSADGYLLTNQHVVGDSRFVKVRWADGAETVGEVVRSDRRRDVAVLKADSGQRQPLALRSTAATLGEAVYAIGTPLDARFQGSVTKGIVSAMRTYDGLPFIQSDVTINRGNSGGPLLDEGGAVIGITVSGMSVSGAPVGVNLFVPIDDGLRTLVLVPEAHAAAAP
ncbi:trypsin-like peptidase domain-containing protein [Phenylobacterium sp.]|uniref:S1C family serine protease n=1 Tax=Phenylobacterium sp. TaxID=1871053 RepID=UPI00301CF98E